MSSTTPYDKIITDFTTRASFARNPVDENGKLINKDPKDSITKVCLEVASFYKTVQDKSTEFCEKIAQIFEMFIAEKNLNPIFLMKEVAEVYIDCVSNPKYGLKMGGRSGIWKFVNMQHLVNREQSKDFVECGYLNMFNELNATTADSSNSAYTTSIMTIYHTLGSQKEYARLTVKAVVALLLKLESTTFESRNYLNYLLNIVNCDREKICEEFAEDLELIKKKYEKSKNQSIKQLLYDLFGSKGTEIVTFLIDYSGSKKKYSFPLDPEIEATVDDVVQFILEKCVEDVDVIESHELQIYDMDIEDFVDFDFVDTDVFKDGNTAKFKLSTTIDFDKKRKKEEQRESELRELSEKSMSIINMSEKHLSDSVQSSQKFDNSIVSSGIEMSSLEMSRSKGTGKELSGIPMSGIEMSGIQMSGIEMSGIQMSGVDMSGIQLSEFSHSISGHGGPLEMPSFISVADNAPKVELTENSLLGGSFDIPDSFKEPVVTSQKDKKTKKIVNETYQILDKIESNDSVVDRKVYIAKDLANKSGPNIVIKYLPIKSSTEFNRCMKEGVNMIRMGRTIQQKKIQLANIFDVFEEEDKEKNKASIRFLCFAMPYYGSGNLQTYLNSKQSLDWPLVYSLFKQIVNGLVYLHEQKIAHKNLKLSNIFFVDKDNVVLTDYGLNSEISSQVPEHTSLMNVENIPIEKFQKADIYQAGLVLASLCLFLNGQSVSNLASILKEGDVSLRNSLGSKVPEKAKDLVVKLLNQDPNERPAIQQVVNLLDI